MAYALGRVEFPNHYGMNYTEDQHNMAETASDPLMNRIDEPEFVVCIIGGSRGIGAQIAYSYALADATGILVTGRTYDELVTVKEVIHEINRTITVTGVIADATDRKTYQYILDRIINSHGRLDVLIYNAAIMPPWIIDETIPNDHGDPGKRQPRGLECSGEDFERVMETNLTGAYFCFQKLLPYLIGTVNGAKTIIAISSFAAHDTREHVSIPYSLSKFALTRLIEHIHEAHHKEGVLAYAVHPGTVDTTLTADKPAPYDQLLTDPDDADLCGGFCTWLSKHRIDWLSGRYLSANWDLDELVDEKHADIELYDQLKFRMVVRDGETGRP